MKLKLFWILKFSIVKTVRKIKNKNRLNAQKFSFSIWNVCAEHFYSQVKCCLLQTRVRRADFRRGEGHLRRLRRSDENKTNLLLPASPHRSFDRGNKNNNMRIDGLTRRDVCESVLVFRIFFFYVLANHIFILTSNKIVTVPTWETNSARKICFPRYRIVRLLDLGLFSCSILILFRTVFNNSNTAFSVFVRNL